MRRLAAFFFLCLTISAHAAGWLPLVSLPLPMDTAPPGVFTAAGSFDWGTSCLTSAWRNGNFVDVITPGPTTTTIKFINCQPDTTTLAALMGVSPTTGIGGLPLAKAYDQSGNGNDAPQGTTSQQFSVWLINGKITVAGDGALSDFLAGSDSGLLDRFLTLPSGVAIHSQNSTIFAVTQQASSIAAEFARATLASTIFSAGSAGAGFALDARFDGISNPTAKPVLDLFDWTSFGSQYLSIFPETNSVVIGAIGTAANFTVTQNEETPVVGTAITLGTSTGGEIGAVNIFGTQYGGIYGQVQAVMIAGNSALNSTQQSAVRRSLYSLFGVPASPTVSMLIDGASLDIAEGGLIGGVQGYGWQQQMLPQISAQIRLGNTSQSGITLETLTNFWPSAQSSFCTGTYAKHVLWAGGFGAAGNSITGGDTGAQAYAALQTYLTAAKASCTWDFIFVNALGNGGAQEAIYNGLVQTNAASLGIIYVPLTSAINTIFNTQGSNPTYFYQSGLWIGHPTPLLYSMMAAQQTAALNAVGIN
jgi:hypothetical protein